MKEAKNSLIFQDFLSKYGQKRLAILTHNRADVDAISSAFAISKALPNSVICTMEEMNEGAKALTSKLSIPVHSLDKSDKAKFEGLVIVDTSAYTLVPEAKGWKVACIIDHHRAEGKDITGEYEIIDTDAPSCAEIVANLISEINADVAFALSVGIIADSARFKSARKETFETLARLMDMGNLNYFELLTYAETEPKEESKVAILKAMQKVSITYGGGYIIATTETGSNESDAASLISEAADVAFVAKWKDREEETRISARGRKSMQIALNKVMAEVANRTGGAGGGHPKAAGAALKVHTDEALKTCVEVFIEMATAKN